MRDLAWYPVLFARFVERNDFSPTACFLNAKYYYEMFNLHYLLSRHLKDEVVNKIPRWYDSLTQIPTLRVSMKYSTMIMMSRGVIVPIFQPVVPSAEEKAVVSAKATTLDGLSTGEVVIGMVDDQDD